MLVVFDAICNQLGGAMFNPVHNVAMIATGKGDIAHNALRVVSAPAPLLRPDMHIRSVCAVRVGVLLAAPEARQAARTRGLNRMPCAAGCAAPWRPGGQRSGLCRPAPRRADVSAAAKLQQQQTLH